MWLCGIVIFVADARTPCSATAHTLGSTPSTFCITLPGAVSGLTHSYASTASSQSGQCHRCSRTESAAVGVRAR